MTSPLAAANAVRSAAPFPRFTYDEAMERFGSDKPDLRFGMELVDLAPLWADGPSGFRVFDDAIAAGGRVKAIVASGLGGATRKEIDELTERAKRFGAKGLVWIAVDDAGTIRGDHGISIQNNLIHGSDSPESAAKEIALWFKQEEFVDYKPVDAVWVVGGDS